jgi:hypothetical protein
MNLETADDADERKTQMNERSPMKTDEPSNAE